ncbi:MAG: imidazole glycerol phosphate synthase subunit HisH [Spirochaetia bacterium]
MSKASVAVVDYRAGNLRSVETALRHIGSKFYITSDPEYLLDADKVIFPGVGEAGSAMKVLNGTGLAEGLREFYRSGKLILGICLGCQIVFDHSEEGDTPCLGLIPGRVVKFPEKPGYKIPHMGWNRVSPEHGHWIFGKVPEGSSFYFVHSYYPAPRDPEDIAALTDYTVTFPSAVSRGNLTALQFHPEKSGEPGLTMLSNFIKR